MRLPRRRFLHLAAGAAALPAIARRAWARSYPTRPVTIIVPFAPGGGADVSGRVAGEHMSRTLGQRFVIENFPGAGGTTGSIRAMRATPDGYTIEVGHIGTHAISVWLYPHLAYKPDVDFAPIGVIVENPLLITARKDFPATNLPEFVAYVRANAEKLNMGHAGVGSIMFSFGLLLNTVLGVKPTLVPFNGGGPATTALLGGQIDYTCSVITDVSPHIRAGALKGFAVVGDERNAALPDVPSTQEAGLPEFKALPWIALFAPKGTPQPILDDLSDALDKALDDEQVRRRFFDLGGVVPDKSRRGQQALATLVKDEIARWGPIIKAADLKRS
ncbi:MAG TPA: tripartite tricarboxylate transporter substrate-binding protein [Xanthobacteraceae bacterium]|jgi:tripartite-type tricarboxylate transporter receptor subunit TctC|nr:tripartite tricarboxylate transporter substrate-binding protein [Xanthobacteraceae bacterium]